MSGWKPFTVFVWLLIIAIIVATIVLSQINVVDCKGVYIPKYADAIKRFVNFRFYDRPSRCAVESVVVYKLNNTKYKVAKMSDYAIYSIATTDISSTNSLFIDVINDPSFLKVIEGYDQSKGQFSSTKLRSTGINILLQLKSKSDMSDFKTLLESRDDRYIYTYLVTGSAK